MPRRDRPRGWLTGRISLHPASGQERHWEDAGLAPRRRAARPGASGAGSSTPTAAPVQARRVRPVRHFPGAGEPRPTRRTHDRSQRRRAPRHGPGRRARPARVHRRRSRRSGDAARHVDPWRLRRGERAPRHRARRPTRHRRIAQAGLSASDHFDRRPPRARDVHRSVPSVASRRLHPVRDGDGDGRPRRGARRTRLPAGQRLRWLVRCDRRAGLPEPPSAFGPDRRARRRNAARGAAVRALGLERTAGPSSRSPTAVWRTPCAVAPTRCGGQGSRL